MMFLPKKAHGTPDICRNYEETGGSLFSDSVEFILRQSNVLGTHTPNGLTFIRVLCEHIGPSRDMGGFRDFAFTMENQMTNDTGTWAGAKSGGALRHRPCTPSDLGFCERSGFSVYSPNQARRMRATTAHLLLTP